MTEPLKLKNANVCPRRDTVLTMLKLLCTQELSELWEWKRPKRASMIVNYLKTLTTPFQMWLPQDSPKAKVKTSRLPLLCFSSNLEELVWEILSNNPTGSTGESLILFVSLLDIVLGSHIQQRVVVMLSCSIYLLKVLAILITKVMIC